MHFYKLYELKCLLAVWTQAPYNDKDPPSVFFISFNTFPFLKSGRSQMTVCVTSAFYLRPVLSELSSVRHCFTAGADVDKNVS